MVWSASAGVGEGERETGPRAGRRTPGELKLDVAHAGHLLLVLRLLLHPQRDHGGRHVHVGDGVGGDLEVDAPVHVNKAGQ